MLTNEEETGNTRAHEENDGRVDVISTAQNAEKMVMETPYDDSTFQRNQNDLGVRVSGKKGINRDQMMRKHRKEHFFTVRVDNLSFDATTSDFRQLFEQILPGESVADVHVPRDYRGGKCNRGFGFVRFLDPRASRSACKEMNGIEHFGRVLDVSFEQPRSTFERTFDRRRQQQQHQQRPYLLRQEPYSRGLENRLSRVQTYENIAGGTFQRRTQRSYRGGSSSYYDAGDDDYHNSHPSSSGYTKPKGELNSLGLPSASSNVRVHVSNLSWETTSDSLAEHCKGLSQPIVRCEVARMSNGKSKGWALMDFESLDQLEEGVKVLHDTELEGRHICVRIERKSVENSVKEGEQMDNPSSGVQVVVRNLPWTTTKDDLSAVFTEVGNVSAATVKCFSDSGRSKGWATVRFETKEEAETAIERFNGTDFGGREIEVRVDRFE